MSLRPTTPTMKACAKKWCLTSCQKKNETHGSHGITSAHPPHLTSASSHHQHQQLPTITTVASIGKINNMAPPWKDRSWSIVCALPAKKTKVPHVAEFCLQPSVFHALRTCSQSFAAAGMGSRHLVLALRRRLVLLIQKQSCRWVLTHHSVLEPACRESSPDRQISQQITRRHAAPKDPTPKASERHFTLLNTLNPETGYHILHKNWVANRLIRWRRRWAK